MKRLQNIYAKDSKIVIGLMSGTSLDGIDVALTRISGCGLTTTVELLDFCTYPYCDDMHQRLLCACGNEASTQEICQLNFDLGEVFGQAVCQLCTDWRFPLSDLDLIGSHGQTVWHCPGHSTLQIGEPAVIAARTGTITIADFRVRDVAAGGQGAPLVPYTEYLLYRDHSQTIALQNIGGIGNVTVMPKNCRTDEIIAFDTGPGNMMIDECIAIMTDGVQRFDKDGRRAAGGQIWRPLLQELVGHPYFAQPLPKTTGRETFGRDYTRFLINKYQGAGLENILTTFTYFTALSIAMSYKRYLPKEQQPQRMIVGGGGSHNLTLMSMLRSELPGIEVITQEQAGFSSDAKEAIAFAVLANECICGHANNLPQVTGAKQPVVMGKICM